MADLLLAHWLRWNTTFLNLVFHSTYVVNILSLLAASMISKDILVHMSLYTKCDMFSLLSLSTCDGLHIEYSSMPRGSTSDIQMTHNGEIYGNLMSFCEQSCAFGRHVWHLCYEENLFARKVTHNLFYYHSRGVFQFLFHILFTCARMENFGS